MDSGERANNVALRWWGLNGMPIWARIVAALGFPIVVASLLLWFVVKDLREHNALLDEHVRQTAAHETSTRLVMEEVVYMLRVLCQNVATTAEQRERCLKAPR